MRLLDSKTGQFRFVHDPRIVRYAIISHTWSQEGKQTYQDILEIQNAVNDPARRPLCAPGPCPIITASPHAKPIPLMLAYSRSASLRLCTRSR